MKVTRQSKVYSVESRDLEAGDRIRMTVNHKPGILAGDLAIVEAIRGIGALKCGSTPASSPSWSRHIEYGYAVESGQRVKADRLLASVDEPAQLTPESPLFKAMRQAFSSHQSLGGCLSPGEVMGPLIPSS